MVFRFATPMLLVLLLAVPAVVYVYFARRKGRQTPIRFSDTRLVAGVQPTARVRQGVAGRLYDTIDDLVENTLKFPQDSYQASIDSVKNRISDEEARVMRYEAALQAQYALMEQTLSLLAQQRNALTMFANSNTSSTA